MQETLFQTPDAEDSLSDSGCRRHSIRQRMQESLYQTADAEVSQSDSGCMIISIRQRMQYSLYHTADAGDYLSDSGCRRHSIRQRMQDTLYQTADAGVSLLNSECRSLSIRQRMPETTGLEKSENRHLFCITKFIGIHGENLFSLEISKYSLALQPEALVNTSGRVLFSSPGLSVSGCRKLSIRQRMQEFPYQTADTGDSLSDSGCRSITIR